MKRGDENKHKGDLQMPNAKIGIVVAEFNRDITEKMLSGTMEALENAKVKSGNIDIVWVPGSFEIPLALSSMAKKKKYDGLVALGCVIKGGTDHYYYVAGPTSGGIMNVMLETGVPIGFGIITVNNLKQAKERVSPKDNKGRDAGEAMLSMINILKK